MNPKICRRSSSLPLDLVAVRVRSPTPSPTDWRGCHFQRNHFRLHHNAVLRRRDNSKLKPSNRHPVVNPHTLWSPPGVCGSMAAPRSVGPAVFLDSPPNPLAQNSPKNLRTQPTAGTCSYAFSIGAHSPGHSATHTHDVFLRALSSAHAHLHEAFDLLVTPFILNSQKSSKQLRNFTKQDGVQACNSKVVDKNRAKCNMGFGRTTQNWTEKNPLATPRLCRIFW